MEYLTLQTRYIFNHSESSYCVVVTVKEYIVISA